MAIVTSCICTGTMASGTGTTTGLTMIGMPTILPLFSQLFSFLSHYVLGEFCFVSCPFQPPSILPTSSSGAERAIYFLSSSDFVSHKIISKIFTVSVFLIASRTYGCFSSRFRNPASEIDSIISINKISIRSPSE